MSYRKLTPQEEADALNDFERAGVGRVKDEIKRNFFDKVSQKVIDAYREEIEQNTGNTSGALKSSIIATFTPDGFDIDGEFYFKFIDEGVNAAPRQSSLNYVKPLQSGSRFSFKNLGVGEGFASSIRQNYGYSMSDAYGVAVGIKKYGIEKKEITDKVITNDFLEDVSEDLSTLLGLAVEVGFNKLEV